GMPASGLRAPDRAGLLFSVDAAARVIANSTPAVRGEERAKLKKFSPERGDVETWDLGARARRCILWMWNLRKGRRANAMVFCSLRLRPLFRKFSAAHSTTGTTLRSSSRC